MAWPDALKLASSKFGRNGPLRLQLVLLVGIAMLPPGILAFWQAGYSYRQALTSLEKNLEQAARLAASEQERVLYSSREILTSLAAQKAIRSSRGAACRQALSQAIAGLAQYEAAAVVDADGDMVCSSDASPPIKTGDRDWFQALQRGEPFVISDLLLSRLTNSWGIVAAVPLNGEDGAMTGAVSLLVGLDSFAETYRHAVLPDRAAFAVLDGNGDLIVSGVESGAVVTGLPAEPELRQQLGLQSPTFASRGRDGVPRVYAISSILNGRIFVVLGVPSSTLLNPLALQFAWGVFTPLLMWVLGVVVVSLGIERLVVRWITYLERVTSDYAAGNRSVRPEQVVDAPAEIRSLGQTFARMADLISAREGELRDSLAQKDMLVREIHHRVKNNLQLVISLLNLHARRVRDPQSENAFAEARGRINALATLHRRLYESENLQDIDLKWFLEDLCNEMRRGGLAAGRDIRLIADLPNVIINADVAVPLGLLVTEAVTNAYKHAFNGRSSGTITLTADREGDGRLCVTVSDDGTGTADPVAGSVATPGTGLGRSLIDAFARQLGGELSIDAADGTTLRLRFPLQQSRPQVGARS